MVVTGRGCPQMRPLKRYGKDLGHLVVAGLEAISRGGKTAV